MKIEFLGASSALASDYENNNFQSNIVIHTESKKKILLDCGTDIIHSSKKIGYQLTDYDAVYISHQHADHIGGLEQLAFSNYFSKSKKKIPFISQINVLFNIEKMITPSIKYIDDKECNLRDFFEVIPQQESGNFNLFNTQFKIVKHQHVSSPAGIMNSYGLIISDNSQPKAYITTDTNEIKVDLIKNLLSENPKIKIFHDCETINKTNVHVWYSELNKLDKNIKKSIYLYHTQPSVVPEWKKDGFAGLVKSGDVIEC